METTTDQLARNHARLAEERTARAEKLLKVDA